MTVFIFRQIQEFFHLNAPFFRIIVIGEIESIGCLADGKYLFCRYSFTIWPLDHFPHLIDIQLAFCVIAFQRQCTCFSRTNQLTIFILFQCILAVVLNQILIAIANFQIFPLISFNRQLRRIIFYICFVGSVGILDFLFQPVRSSRLSYRRIDRSGTSYITCYISIYQELYTWQTVFCIPSNRQIGPILHALYGINFRQGIGKSTIFDKGIFRIILFFTESANVINIRRFCIIPRDTFF